MKSYRIGIIVLTFLLFPLAKVLAMPASYQIDPLHSYVQWHISHFGFSEPSGKWFAKGTLLLDETNLRNSKIDVNINVADITTGISELDKHLKEPLFFDVVKFPEATFSSNKVTMTGKNTADVSGMLTVKGISKPIVLKMTLNKIGTNPISNKMTAGFHGTTELKRSDFNINTLLPGLGDKIVINLEVEANR